MTERGNEKFFFKIIIITLFSHLYVSAGIVTQKLERVIASLTEKRLIPYYNWRRPIQTPVKHLRWSVRVKKVTAFDH